MPAPAKLPLHHIESAQGAVLASFHNWEVPAHYGNAREEYKAVRQEIGSMDLCYSGKLRASGRDCARYLHNMLSNDILNLKPGSGCYATLLTHQGRMESDLYVYALSDEFRLEEGSKGDFYQFFHLFLEFLYLGNRCGIICDIRPWLSLLRTDCLPGCLNFF